MRLILLIIGLAGAPGRAQPQPSYDCNLGCPGDGHPVCGEDGITYLNSCLATCQGVRVVNAGGCGGTRHAAPKFKDTTSTTVGSTISSSSSSSPQGAPSLPAITQQQMHRYRQQGFVLTGRAATASWDPRTSNYLKRQQRQRGAAAAAAAGGRPVEGPAAAAAGFAGASGSRSVLQQPLPAAAAVRQAGDGLVYYLSPQAAAVAAGTSAITFEDGKSSAALLAGLPQEAVPVWGQAAPGFDPWLQQQEQQPLWEQAQQPLQQQQQASRLAAVLEDATTAVTATAAAQAGTALGSTGPEQLVQHMRASGRRRLSARWQQAMQVLRHGTAAQQQQQLPLSGKGQQPPTLPLSALGPGGQQQQRHHHHHRRQQQQTQHQHQHRALQAAAYVIGADSRREVAGGGATSSSSSSTSTSLWPYSAIGQLLYARGSCTGVMVGPQAVLTAAHCVFSRTLNAWQADMVFIPHRHRRGGRTVEPFGRVPVESATVYAGWSHNPNATDALQYDLAVVRLAARGIGYRTGFLGLAWDTAPFRGTVHTAGYPGDKARGSLWRSSCRVTDFGGNDARFLNTCDSWSGQSGAPLWEQRGRGTYLLRAVMSYEACACCTADCRCCTDHQNGACKITQQHYENVLKWR